MKNWLKWLNVALIATVLMGFSSCSDDSKGNGNDGDGDISFVKNINLPSKYKSNSDTLKNIAKIVFSDGKIYAALQYLDAMSWEPVANSIILEIDASSENILRTFSSKFQNVIDIEIKNGELFVSDVGSHYVVGDGGVTKIDLTSETATIVLDGSQINAEPKKMQFVSNNEGYIIISKSYSDENWVYYEDERIAKFGISGNTMNLDYSELGTMNTISDISYNSFTNSLWFGSGNSVSKYSVANKKVEFDTITALPVTALKSAGATTITVESDYTTGKYGIIYDLGISETPIKYYSYLDIGNDATVGFADGNFFVLERPFGGAQKMKFLTADGDIIDEINFSTSAFNAYSVCGNGNNRIFINSYQDGIISVFETN